MGVVIELPPILLALAFVSIGIAAWILGRRNGAARTVRLPRDYYVGLDHLINDRFDHAAEIFSRMAQADGDAAEIQFALGSLFRRRGEVDRAIAIHSGLREHGAVALRDKAAQPPKADNQPAFVIASDPALINFLRLAIFFRPLPIDFFQRPVDRQQYLAVVVVRVDDVGLDFLARLERFQHPSVHAFQFVTGDHALLPVAQVNRDQRRRSRNNRSFDQVAFLQAGADVNSKDRYGWNPSQYSTALYRAVWRQNVELVRLLVAQKGISLNDVDGECYTALEIAQQKGHPTIIDLLLQAGADPSVTGNRAVASVMVNASAAH